MSRIDDRTGEASVIAVAAADEDSGAITARRMVFYGVFVFLILVYAVIVPGFYLPEFRGISLTAMGAVAVMSPIVVADIPFVGDLIPAVLGAVIGGSAPKTANIRQLVGILVVACLTYLMYVHMTAFFAEANGQLVEATLDTELTRRGINPDTLKTLADSCRNFTVFVFSTLIGIRFSTTGSVAIPMQRPQQVEDGAPVPAEKEAAAVTNAGAGRTNG